MGISDYKQTRLRLRLRLGSAPTEEEIDALFEKVGTMGVDDRRKTLLSLAGSPNTG